ncbi:MAG TPA: MarR family transcriptional regulator, partial [Acetobacteraceae bacterium]
HPAGQLDQQDYRTLSEFRYLVRRFLAFSADAARGAGLTSRQHQALLAIKGFAGEGCPTVGDLAALLCIQHHSAVELADRLVEGGLILRTHDSGDRRRVRLGLTAAAERHLAGLSAIHLEELHRLRPTLLQILDRIGEPAADGDPL